jgi:hypothetical protein
MEAHNFGLYEIAHSLSNICRFNGHCNKFYSVLDHSLNTAKLAATHREYILFLTHDIAESIIGDIPTPMKWYFQSIGIGDKFKEMEKSVDAALRNHLNLPFPETIDEHDRIKWADLEVLNAERQAFGMNVVNEWYTPLKPVPKELAKLEGLNYSQAALQRSIDIWVNKVSTGLNYNKRNVSNNDTAGI